MFAVSFIRLKPLDTDLNLLKSLDTDYRVKSISFTDTEFPTILRGWIRIFESVFKLL